MKVYGSPLDWQENWNDDHKARATRIEAYEVLLVEELKKLGFTGKNTGRKCQFQVADGYAEYMLADGKKSALIHLSYGDGYQYRDVEFLPKKEIMARIEQRERQIAFFEKRKTEMK